MGKNNGKGKSAKGGNVICKLKSANGKLTLEIICNPGKITPYREGKIGLGEAVVAEEIFTNASKFQKAKEAEINLVTGGLSGRAALEAILKRGTFPLTRDELNSMCLQKRTEIVNHIHTRYHDPRPNIPLPHPISRIENVLETMKVRIDPNESAEWQLKRILKTLPEYLPIKPLDTEL